MYAAEQYELFDLNLYRLAEIGRGLYCLSLKHIREDTFCSLLQRLYQTSYRSWFLFGLVEYGIINGTTCSPNRKP